MKLLSLPPGMVESGGTAMYAREEAAAGELLGSLGMLSTDTSNGMLAEVHRGGEVAVVSI